MSKSKSWIRPLNDDELEDLNGIARAREYKEKRKQMMEPLDMVALAHVAAGIPQAKPNGFHPTESEMDDMAAQEVGRKK